MPRGPKTESSSRKNGKGSETYLPQLFTMGLATLIMGTAVETGEAPLPLQTATEAEEGS